MIFKSISIIILTFICQTSFSQDSLCNSICPPPIFQVNLNKKNVKKGAKNRVYYSIGSVLIDYVDYTKKGEVKKVNGKRLKSNHKFDRSKILNTTDTSGFKQGIWLDSNYQFSHILKENKVLIGIGEYKNGIKNGEWVFYDQQTKQKYALTNYVDGKLEGKVSLFNKNKVFGEVIYSSDCKNGEYKLFYFNGKLSETGRFNCGVLEHRLGFKKNGGVRYFS